MRIRSTFLVAAVVGWFSAGSARAADETVDFVKQIKPILERSCVKCHGAERPKGRLVMLTRAALLKGGRNGPAIVPGDAGDSLLYDLITLPPDDLDVMPNEGDPLTKAEQNLFRDWINQGAKWPDDLALVDPSAAAEEAKTPESTGVPITEAEEKVVAQLLEAGVLAIRLAQNVNWLRVDFQRSDQVKDEVLKTLKPVANLYELDLGGTNVTDASLAALKDLTSLRRLYLERTKVTDAGLKNIAGLANLTYLNLYGTEITDQGLAHLAGLKQLRNLFLWQTQTTDDGVAKLKEVLPECTVDQGWELKPVEPPKEEEAEKKDEEKKEDNN